MLFTYWIICIYGLPFKVNTITITLNYQIMNIILSNHYTSNWDESKPVRILLTGFQGAGTLTGKWEEQEVCGEPRAMLEVSHSYGTDMIFEDYLAQ